MIISKPDEPNRSLDSEETARSARADGNRFFLKWFVVGGLVAFVTFVTLLIAGMGGVRMPPDIWMTFRFLGMFVLPFLLTLGGVPAANQIANGQPWKRSAVIAFVVCATSWVVVVGVVLLGPSIFGWSW